MHGQNICVYVTLSVISLTGQTPQRIFTVDSLKDADIRKGVPFGMSWWWIITFTGPKFPKTPILEGLNRHFKPNTRKIQIDLCIRLTWNLTGSCGQQQGLRGWSRMVVKQLQDGGRPTFLKSLYRHISAKNHPISMKFCTQQQILNWMNVTWSKIKKVALDRLRVRQAIFLVGYTSCWLTCLKFPQELTNSYAQKLKLVSRIYIHGFVYMYFIISSFTETGINSCKRKIQPLQ